MFTGIVEAVGTVERVDLLADGRSRRLAVATPLAHSLRIGDSIAVQGCCLTVVDRSATAFAAELSPTTLAITTLGQLGPGSLVNLERAATPETRLGGHFVQGHVDTQGVVRRVEAEGAAKHLRLEYPRRYASWVVDQGSVAVDGVSLTVVGLGVEGEAGWLAVTLIPHTLGATTLGRLTVGERVNLEFDVLGKYVARLLAPYGAAAAHLPGRDGDQPSSGGLDHAGK